MNTTHSYTIDEIISIYREAISGQDDVLCRLLLSVYCYCSLSPSESIVSAIGLQADNLDLIFDKNTLSYLKENYTAVTSSLIKELSHSPSASNNSIIDSCAINAAMKNSHSKWEGVFVLGAGINNFLQERPEKPIFGLELDSRLWGLGQIYIESQNWDNVYIFQSAGDIPWNKAFQSILLLSADTKYQNFVNKGIGNSFEFIGIFPREWCITDDCLEFRQSLVKKGFLQTLTVVHTGSDGLAIIHCLDTYKKTLRNTRNVAKRITIQAFHILFPRIPSKGLMLLTSLLAADFFFFTILLILHLLFKSIELIPEPATSLMWGVSALLFMVAWLACRITAQESHNPQIQFAAVLNFKDADPQDWEVLMAKALKKHSDTEKCSALMYHSTSLDKDMETQFSRYFVAQKSISFSDMRAFVFLPEVECQALSNIVSTITPLKITDTVERPFLHIVGGAPLSANYLECEIEKDLSDNNGRNYFSPRYYVPGDTYIWHYSPSRMRVGHVSKEVALANSFNRTRTLLFSPISSIVEKEFLLKELLSGFVQEQLLWLGHNPTVESLLNVRIRVPSLEQQNRELRADAFEYLETEHRSFVAMVTNHKHEVGNLLKFLYYDFDILKLQLDAKGRISIDDIVDPRKGSTVRDYFLSIEGYKTAIGQEMMNFWNEGYGKEEEFNLKDVVDSFVKTKATSPYSVDAVIPNDTKVIFSRKGLSTILRNVFVNAEKHGFTDMSKKDYAIKIWQEDIQIDGQEFARLFVANNGSPLPEGITQHNMFEAGTGTGESEHIGCHTIKEICDEFGGYVSFEQYHGHNELSVSYMIDLPKA